MSQQAPRRQGRLDQNTDQRDSPNQQQVNNTAPRPMNCDDYNAAVGNFAALAPQWQQDLKHHYVTCSATAHAAPGAAAGNQPASPNQQAEEKEKKAGNQPASPIQILGAIFGFSPKNS